MIRSIVFPRVMGKYLPDLQPALNLFRALGFALGNEWHEGGSHGIEMLAPSGGVEFIAAPDTPTVDVTVEVSDADEAWAIARKMGGVKIQREIADTPYGARQFEVEVGGLRVGFLTYARKAGDSHGVEGRLDAAGKQFALVVSRFNSFITERLLDGAVQALRQCGAKPENMTIVHVPGAFEIPSAARQLADTKRYHAIVCIGCLLRGGTLHYEVIANEVARGVGQSAQETGVPHAFGVLTCDTLEQAIDRAGLKAGNKGFEAGLAAVEMAGLRDQVRKVPAEEKAGPSTALRSARDDKSKGASARDDKSGRVTTGGKR
jgi:6,7-dimethyl-8-ribityllumazine synthase